MNRVIVIDIQGFKTSDKTFTVKEFAAYNGKQWMHYIFKQPFSYDLLPEHLKRQARYLMDHHHCIRWETGFTPAHTFKDIIVDITSHYDTIYVKGEEKRKFIADLVSRNVMELEEPKIILEEPICFNHSKTPCICALNNVFSLYETYIMRE